MQNASPLKNQIDLLFQQEISPEQFYRQYLQILTQSIQGMRGCHLWLLQGAQFVPLGGSDREAILFDSDSEQQAFVLDQIARCARDQKTHFESYGGTSANKCALGLAFTPLLYGEGGGAVQGAQVSWWGTTAGQELTPQTLDLLDECGRGAARMARVQKLESMSQLSERLQLMARFLDEISAAPDLQTLAVTLVNRARELVECDRCALVVERVPGNLSVEAVSNVPAFDSRSAVARTILQMSENAKVTGLPTGYRKANEKTEERGDLSDYFYLSKMEEVLIVGIQAPNKDLLGMLVLESAKIGFFDRNRHQTAVSLGQHSVGSLQRTIQYDSIPLRPLVEKIARWRRLPHYIKRQSIKRFLWIPAAILFVFLIFPVKYQFSGDARLLPCKRALVVAEVPGRVVEILVEDGQTVEASQPIAKLDDSELSKQKQIAHQEEARFLAETDRLTAQNDSAAARIAALALQRAKSEREFYEEQHARTVIRSPIKGLVMTPNISSRQGDALPVGGQLALVGDPSSWELEINVPESDIVEVIDRLQGGASIQIRYLLSSIPQKKFTTQISGLSSISGASEVVAGKNVFKVTASLPPESEYASLFRAGYTGRARLEMGYRPLIYTATRRFFNWLRINVLF
jgi:biotin carboxyl carrier protein